MQPPRLSYPTKTSKTHSPSSLSQPPIPTAVDPLTPPFDQIDSNQKSGLKQLSPTATQSEAENQAVSPAVETHSTGERKSRKYIEGTPEPKEEAPQVPGKETVTRLITRTKERQTSNGPDVFLGLLDLVRKK
ncbi:hypothetical protein E8E11_009460 [Didymella keratinophila]|nr:hypothetical protein E8E11_009460 [Didymella keratinophila]